MFIAEMNAHGNSGRADEGPAHHDDRPVSMSSSTDISSSTTDEDYATARGSVQRGSLSSAGGSGLGITSFSFGGDDSSGNHSSHSISSTNTTNRRRASAPHMGFQQTTITAAAGVRAQAQAQGGAGNPPKWPGGIMRQTEVRVESREMDRQDAVAEMRRPASSAAAVHYMPRPSSLAEGDGRGAVVRDMAAFLRDVTPPPTNFMSVPSLSSRSSSLVRRRKSSRLKKGAVGMVAGLLRRVGDRKLVRRFSSSGSKKRPASPELQRSSGSRRNRRPLIKLPDTAVAGRTIDGHRHIAISIPIEHANLGPGPRQNQNHGYPSTPPGTRTRSRSLSSAETSRRFSADSAYQTRPLTAFARATAEPVHIGTQLGPLAEERESSLSSRSWERGSSEEQRLAAHKVHLANSRRNTFGALVHEERSSSSSSSMMGALPSPHMAAPDKSWGGGEQRPASAHSFRSFAAATSPLRVYCPMRRSSLQTAGVDTRRSRAISSATGATDYSRDSSRDQTLQGSIFSEQSYLESLLTVESGELYASPILTGEATFAKVFAGQNVVEFEPRRSFDSARRCVPERGSSHVSANTKATRTSGNRRLSASDKGKQRASYEPPAAVAKPSRHSGDSAALLGERPVVKPDVMQKDGATSNTSAILDNKRRRSAPVPARGLAAAADIVPMAKQQGWQEHGNEAPKTPTPRRSRFVESLREAPSPQEWARKAESQEGEVQSQVATPGSTREIDVKGKGKEIQRVTEPEPPSIELERATPTKTKKRENPGKATLRKRRSSNEQVTSDRLAVGALRVPRERTRSREGRIDKDKPRKENSPDRAAEQVEIPSTPDAEATETRDTSGPALTPEDNSQRKKSVFVSRKQRIAALMAKLEKPGSKPSDLLWERRLSASSTSSSESTPSTPKAARSSRELESLPHTPSTLSPMVPQKRLSLAQIVTVADVQPFTPDTHLARVDSIPRSVSSFATISTLIKTSPVPPYQTFGSVTPPDSPAYDQVQPDTVPFQSPTSQYSPLDDYGAPVSQRLSSPVISRITRRTPGRTSPIPSTGRRSPILIQEGRSTRPRTAGKSALASNKAASEAFSATPNSPLNQDANSADASIAAPHKSILKMSRSEIFDHYEALRETQTRDMERRVRRLERNGDYWLTAILPILSDVSQTLKTAVGKGSDDLAREAARYDDGRKSRLAGRMERIAGGLLSTPRSEVRSSELGSALDRDEVIVRHGEEAAPGRRRLHLYDDDDHSAADLRFEDGTSSPATTTGDRGFSLDAVIDGLNSRHQQQQQQQYSGSTTMVGTSFGGGVKPRAASVASTTVFREGLLAEEAERIARLEEMTARINAEARFVAPRTPLSSARDRASSSVGWHGGLSAESSEGSLRSYQGTEEDIRTMEEHWGRQRGGLGRGEVSSVPGDIRRRSGGGGNYNGINDMDSLEPLTPLMRELQIAGSRVSLESPASEDLGDYEVRRMRQLPGPRAVVGFGAFSMRRFGS